ncbi:MAG: aminoacetone oxidase family FAD-binding enzyme [Gemmataceae bacterium]
MADYDAIIVGAGAAGLMAAIHAAERGRRVLLLEKGKKPGVKILMSGGTRCNITHDCDARGIVAAFGPNGKFLHSALAAFGPADVLEFFHAEGVATKVEETGKIFPVSDRAVDVLDALLKRLQRSGATLSLSEPVNAIEPDAQARAGSTLACASGSFQIITTSRSLSCEKLLITTGGRSYPGCGTTGDGYAWAARLGHTICPSGPLVPLTVTVRVVADLTRHQLPDVNLKVLDEEQTTHLRRGSMLFAHFDSPGRPRSM